MISVYTGKPRQSWDQGGSKTSIGTAATIMCLPPMTATKAINPLGDWRSLAFNSAERIAECECRNLAASCLPDD